MTGMRQDNMQHTECSSTSILVASSSREIKPVIVCVHSNSGGTYLKLSGW